MVNDGKLSSTDVRLIQPLARIFSCGTRSCEFITKPLPRMRDFESSKYEGYIDTYSNEANSVGTKKLSEWKGHTAQINRLSDLTDGQILWYATLQPPCNLWHHQHRQLTYGRVMQWNSNNLTDQDKKIIISEAPTIEG